MDKKAKGSTANSILACFLLLSIGLVIIILSYFSISEGGTETVIDAYAFADTARQICRGEGFSTGIIWPLALGYSHSIDRFPDLYNAPLYSLILGIFFKIFGPSNGTVHLCTTMIYLATIALTFVFAREVFGLGAAFLAGILFSINGDIIANVLKGNDVLLLVFLMTALLYVIYKIGVWEVRGSIVTGALLGLCTLVLYPVGLLLVPLMVYGFFAGGKDRGRCLAALGGGFLVVTLMWFIRNTVVSGNPFTCLSWSMLRYNFSLPSMTMATFNEEASFSFIDLTRNLQRLSPIFILGTFLLPFFIIATLKQVGNPKFQKTIAIAWLFLGCLFLEQAMTKRVTTKFMFTLPFLPFVTMTACGYIFAAITIFSMKRPMWRYCLIGIFTILNIADSGHPLHSKISPSSYEHVWLEQSLSAYPRDAVLMTLRPDFQAWYLDRKTMLIPSSLEDYDNIKKLFGSNLAVHLEEDIPYYSDYDGTPWVKIVESVQDGYNPKVLGLSWGIEASPGNWFLMEKIVAPVDAGR